ncbi:MAG: surface lipoprotein assembly modifier [Pseudomonadota bacterium]
MVTSRIFSIKLGKNRRALALGFLTSVLPLSAGVWATAPSSLREGPSPQLRLSPAASLELTRKLIADRKFDLAAQVLDTLEQVPAGEVDKNDLLFLRGLLFLERGDFKPAIEVFRTMLDQRPEIVRVRLELARALFGARRDRAAAYHFRLALAGDITDAARQNIRMFLWLIEKRKVWRINARANLVPDTNVSAGPRNSTIELNGIPFELDENGVARSGLGFTIAAVAEVFPRLSKHWRLEGRAGGAFTDYSNRSFDDLSLTAEFGLRYEKNGSTLSVLASASRRVFGGEGFNYTAGGRVVLQKGLNRRTALQTSFGAARVTYDRDVQRNGAQYFFGTTLQRALTARSLARVTTTLTREQTATPSLRNTTVQLRAAYRRELPWGITAEAGPNFYYRPFDDTDPSFDPRVDWSYGASVYITKRDWRLYGFAPVFSYEYIRNNSTIDRFNFDRHRANIGITRTF